MNVVDRAWLAGLLEGEGCFTFHKQNYRRKRDGGLSIYIRPAIVLVMTDRDVVDRAAHLLGDYAVQVRDRRGRKVIYGVTSYGPRAAQTMRELRPFLGDRRRARIDEVLTGGLA